MLNNKLPVTGQLANSHAFVLVILFLDSCSYIDLGKMTQVDFAGSHRASKSVFLDIQQHQTLLTYAIISGWLNASFRGSGANI
jgi:hypothetical protein